MLSFNEKQVYLACGVTDMRKSINGLASIVSSSFSLDPTTNAAFVFCNKNRDRIKILEWDVDGFWLYLKRLERGRFPWPEAKKDGKPEMTLTADEFMLMLQGTKLTGKLKRQEITGQIVS